jgi:hypothetical protein
MPLLSSWNVSDLSMPMSLAASFARFDPDFEDE